MIKFFLLFIPRIVIENWKRFLLLAASITLFISAYMIERETVFSSVQSIFQDGGKYYYELYNGGTETFDKEQTLFPDKMNESNLCLKRQVFGPGNIACCIIGVITLISFIVISFMEDWDATETTKDILYESHETEAIDGIYHHHAFGRLIAKGPDQQLHLRWFGPTDFFRLPRYKSKKQEREDKLNKIGL
jgi:hypothetical protein